MTKNLNLMLAAVLGLGGLMPLSAEAIPVTGPSVAPSIVPVDAKGNLIEDPALYGVAVATMSTAGTIVPNNKFAQTVAKVWASGPGQLFDVELASGAATTEYVICIDTAPTMGSAGGSNVNPVALVETDDALLDIRALCHRSATVSTTCFGAGGTGRGLIGKTFKHGLVCDASSDRWYAPLFREFKSP